ncbi:acyl-CoA dehydrogenase/oxidase C-terminal [Ampelomyces quisqualis]|uniref:Acyl-CoA dehydrogenase/oxidase C-terminal n=1 Tax=Ampelomyces quisqualis TaxID=50730 RepID=A0A6A5R3X2_AMPQU|nr:acyl-CoA dehydrogenase/oxidase C-terminal [Ampelomyces quisqualis]
MDNGYMLFDHVRVPRSAMLSRYAEVSEEVGVFVRTLTFVRGQIIMHVRLVLARAVTVAVRYCSIRSIKVLDYPTVQIRILPLLATTFALHYTGEYMYELYRTTTSRQTIENGDFGPLAELHSASSRLKSLCTILAADGIETCRRAMGGHGFSGGSGLVGLNSDYLSKPIFEGDNWMITQQVAAYLIKKMDPTEEFFQYYLENRSHHIPQTLIQDGTVDDRAIVDIFQSPAADLSSRAYKARENSIRARFSLSSPTPSVLKTGFRLYAVYTLDQYASSFITTTAVNPEAVYTLQHNFLEPMADLRPHAVKLLDAWSITDWLHDSALGRSDGKVEFNPDWRSEEIVLGSEDGGKHSLAKL